MIRKERLSIKTTNKNVLEHSRMTMTKTMTKTRTNSRTKIMTKKHRDILYL